MVERLRRGGVAIAVGALVVAGCDLGRAAVVHPAPSRLVEVVDVNGDGALDVVTAGPGAHRVLLNDGAGGLKDGAPVPVDAEIAAFAIADLDRDGAADRIDVTHTATGSSSLLLARGDGAGGFGAQEVAVADALTEVATALDVVDIDGDGDQDVVLAGHGFDVFRNDGTGSLTRSRGSFGICGSNSSGGHYSALLTQLTHADIDRDGDEDVVMAGGCEETENLGPSPGVWLQSNDGTGRFVYGSGAGGNGAVPYVGLSVGDVDEDGHLDFIAGNPSTSAVDIVRGDGRGSFVGRTTVATPSPPGDVAVADIDGDGHLDVVVTAAGTGFARVLYGDGTGSFPESHVLATGGDVVGPVAVGGIDGDGSVDLVFGNDVSTADSSVAVLVNTLDGRQH